MEAFLALALARVLLFSLPWSRTSALLGRFAAPAGTGAPPSPRDTQRARAVARRVRGMADRLPWHSTCLVRAVAGMLLLARRGIPGSGIRFGVRKEDGRLSAHAWLILGSEVLLGGEEADTYVPLADLVRRSGGGAA
nr:lasso peptide biosynthesis B2 protein [Azospirillum soli]